MHDGIRYFNIWHLPELESRELQIMAGLTFALKLMEKREGIGSKLYTELPSVFPEAENFSKDERNHESAILGMLNEEGLSMSVPLYWG